MRKHKWLIISILSLIWFAFVIFYFCWLKWYGGLDTLAGQNEAVLVSGVATSSLIPLAIAIVCFRIWQEVRNQDQGIPLPFPEIASLRNQFRAGVLDGLIFTPLVLIRFFYFPKSAALFLILYSLRFLLPLYTFVFDCTTGATIGKKLMKIRTRHASGGRLPLHLAFLRMLPAVLAPICILCLLLGNFEELQAAIDGWPQYDGLEYALGEDLPLYVFFFNAVYVMAFMNIVVLALNPKRRALNDIISRAVVQRD